MANDGDDAESTGGWHLPVIYLSGGAGQIAIANGVLHGAAARHIAMPPATPCVSARPRGRRVGARPARQ